MFQLLIVSFCYMFGTVLGLFLSGYTLKRLSLKEIEEEEKEQQMIAQMELKNFEYLYQDEVCDASMVDLDDDAKKELKNKVITYVVPGNTIKMFYDVDKEGYCYYTQRGEVGYKYLNVVCRKYVLEHNVKQLYREGMETIELHTVPKEMDACFSRKKTTKQPMVQENKRINKFIHLGTFQDYEKKLSMVPIHKVSFKDYFSRNG